MPFEPERKKILVVDDEPEARVFLSSILETGGYFPILAESADEGIRRVYEDPPDLIILDMMMTRDGVIRMFGDLYEREVLRNIPVIMLSDIDEKVFNYYCKLQPCAMGRELTKPEAYLEKPRKPTNC